MYYEDKDEYDNISISSNEEDITKRSAMNNSLLKLFNKEDKNLYKCDYNPPKNISLNNSFRIIPEYYIKNGNLLHIDFYQVILDDIRNYRNLNKYQLEYIKDLDNEKKMEIINLYNHAMDLIIKIL